LGFGFAAGALLVAALLGALLAVFTGTGFGFSSSLLDENTRTGLVAAAFFTGFTDSLELLFELTTTRDLRAATDAAVGLQLFLAPVLGGGLTELLDDEDEEEDEEEDDDEEEEDSDGGLIFNPSPSRIPKCSVISL